MLTDYLPSYPAIEDKDFFKSIVNKREFWEKEEFPQFFQHQVNIARFMSQWTMYDSLLLFHEMGTGKSGVTVALTELCRKEVNPELKKIVYITHNQPLIENYKKEIEKFSPRLADQLKEKEKEKALRWNTILRNDGYEFYTMGVLDNEFSKKPDEWIQQRYENSIFLIDEAHHLVKKKEENKASFDQLVRILNLIQVKKVLVMTGTPITDQPDEIVPLLHLVLPPHMQALIPPRSEFIRTLFEVQESVEVLTGIRLPVYQWRPGQREFFQQLIRGRVSYIRRKMTDVPVVYEGSIYPPMQSLPLVVGPMKSIQNYVYSKYFESEAQKLFEEEEEEAPEETLFGSTPAGKKKKAESSFYSKSRQASLFVFPDDSIGEEEEDTAQIWARQKRIASDFFVDNKWTISPAYIRKMFDVDLQVLQKKDKEEILSILSQYSSTYTKVCSEILNHPNELVYIFCDLKEKSGVMVLQALLRTLFGFLVIRSPKDLKKTPNSRLIVLNDPFTEEKDFQEILAYFNDPENKNGKWCQVIIGTEKTSEGISLKNVQQIHIVTPTWNMGTMSQAMARSLRAKAHEAGQKVRIFLHAAVPTEEVDESEGEDIIGPPIFQHSVDYQRYFRSEIKERNMKLVERVFLESSWDCAMNHDINSKTGRYVDGSRECEYDICDYKCEGVSPSDPLGKDTSNWNLFYSSVAKEHIITKIKSLFRQKSFYLKEDLVQKLLEVVDDSTLVHQCLLDCIHNPIMLKDYRMFPAFLSFNRDSFFLLDNPFLPDPIGNYGMYYQENPATLVKYDFSNVLDGFYYRNLPDLIYKLLHLMSRTDSASEENAKDFFLSFPLTVQRIFLEESILKQQEAPERITNIEFKEWFKKQFPTNVEIIGNQVHHYFVPEKNVNKRVLYLNNLEQGWVDRVIKKKGT